MPAIICMLRAVNLGAHNKIKMDALRALCGSLGLRDACTYVQSGNVVFNTNDRNLARVSKRIQDAIARKCGFRTDVILRTAAELREVIARNPFAKRRGIEAAKLHVFFLAADPGAEARETVLQIKTDPEELRITGQELYIYFPNGMGKSKLSFAAINRTLRTPATARNWNTVTKLLEIAEELESAL